MQEVRAPKALGRLGIGNVTRKGVRTLAREEWGLGAPEGRCFMFMRLSPMEALRNQMDHWQVMRRFRFLFNTYAPT